MTPSILEKDLQRNWPIGPKKMYPFKHTQNPPRIVSLKRKLKDYQGLDPKDLKVL
jgi:hypothetical protein